MTDIVFKSYSKHGLYYTSDNFPTSFVGLVWTCNAITNTIALTSDVYDACVCVCVCVCVVVVVVIVHWHCYRNKIIIIIIIIIITRQKLDKRLQMRQRQTH